MPSNGKLQRIAMWSIVVALGIFALKLAAWWLTDSVALFSDAMESVVNVVASCVAWYALRIAHTPADDNHPFGHHKAEYFSAVLEGVLIVVAALLIIHEAWTVLFEPRPLAAPVVGLAINGLAAVGNGLWAWLLISTGRKARSPAMVADGKHLWTDVVTSAGVIFGLVLAVATGWYWLDPTMALVVALNILWHGWHLVGDSVQGLMDVSVEPEELARIERVIADNDEGALEFHDLKTREAGRARFIEFHLVVPSDMTVEAAHRICDRIEGALEKAQPGAEVTIHVEPEHKAKFS
ncbi:cation diffusion facilitator family transporter [Nitratireductor sp. L1-7-SE]|uniref:Cation diffusion facilitator family transporter n=1 Tax=Nitratireductor rhodophyticola TaxID=2854036 RepID=A0ABS7R9C5_9HYPH|nr:cation diffusion facilitator family transporter [Nitratireductor rhodophyticola]MBY8917532.1 cation diffusion facilitator family transporter [Nitratireductor rhodophyticola]MBY8922243.1 cation diffusion facilitator family transporter [Nitratireductor rhodophyticola]